MPLWLDDLQKREALEKARAKIQEERRRREQENSVVAAIKRQARGGSGRKAHRPQVR